MLPIIEGILLVLVLFGSITIVWGVRRFKLSSSTVAVAFAITAASWLALLIVTIGITLKALGLPRV